MKVDKNRGINIWSDDRQTTKKRAAAAVIGMPFRAELIFAIGDRGKHRWPRLQNASRIPGSEVRVRRRTAAAVRPPARLYAQVSRSAASVSVSTRFVAKSPADQSSW